MLGEHWLVAVPVDDSEEDPFQDLAHAQEDSEDEEDSDEGEQYMEDEASIEEELEYGVEDDWAEQQEEDEEEVLEEEEPEVKKPKKRKKTGQGKRGKGKKKSIFARPDSDSDTDEELPAAAPTVDTVSLGGRVRKQTQHFAPLPVPKTKKSRSKASPASREDGSATARGERGRGGRGRGGRGGRGRARGGGRGRAGARGRGSAAAGKSKAAASGKGKAKRGQKTKKKKKKKKNVAKTPSRPPPRMETRWKTHAIGLEELEGLLFSDNLNNDVATMIREVWLPEGQQKIKHRQRQTRRMNSQLKALSFGDAGGFGDPLGVEGGGGDGDGGGRRRRTAVNYSEAAYDQQINEAIRESNKQYRRGGARSPPPAAEPAHKRGAVRTTRQGRGKYLCHTRALPNN